MLTCEDCKVLACGCVCMQLWCTAAAAVFTLAAGLHAACKWL